MKRYLLELVGLVCINVTLAEGVLFLVGSVEFASVFGMITGMVFGLLHSIFRGEVLMDWIETNG